MKKRLLIGLISAATVAVAAVGATSAAWIATAPVGGTTRITSGDLNAHLVDEPIWQNISADLPAPETIPASNYTVTPGDVLVGTYRVVVDLSGDNLAADIAVSVGFTAEAPLSGWTAVSTTGDEPITANLDGTVTTALSLTPISESATTGISLTADAQGQATVWVSVILSVDSSGWAVDRTSFYRELSLDIRQHREPTA